VPAGYRLQINNVNGFFCISSGQFNQLGTIQVTTTVGGNTAQYAIPMAGAASSGCGVADQTQQSIYADTGTTVTVSFAYLSNGPGTIVVGNMTVGGLLIPTP
jgi:hypothetical protein